MLPRGWKGWALIGLAAAIVVYFGSYFFPAEYQVCRPDDYSHAKQCGYYHFGPSIPAGIIAWADIHNGLVTAFATVMIVIFTGTLWRTSDDTLSAIKRQGSEFLAIERPYVYAIPTGSSLRSYFEGETKPSITFVIKNAGRGPARIKHVICTVGVAKTYEEASHSQHRVDVAETWVLAEKETETYTFDDLSVSLVGAIPESLNRNLQSVFITPWVSYIDAGGKTHDTMETWRLFPDGDGFELRHHSTGRERYT
jgi:hypothetical protein